LWTAMSGSSNLLAGMRGTRPSADYNADGTVNSSDYTAWRNAFARSAFPYADGNHNNVVDAADYVLWRKTRTAGAGTEIVSVPEPTSLWCLASVVAFFIVRRRRLC
jgi:hypothetical protein